MNSERTAPLRVVGRPFAPGQSGNPRGRPKINPDVKALARKHAPEALARLIALMKHPRPEIALRACEVVLDRAYGRTALLDDPSAPASANITLTWTAPKEKIPPTIGGPVIEERRPSTWDGPGRVT